MRPDAGTPGPRRFPGFSSIAQAPHWDAATRDLVLSRLQPPKEMRLLDVFLAQHAARWRAAGQRSFERSGSREFLKAADVVPVIMRDDQVIDLLDSRRVEHLHNPVVIALARISGVFEECFSRRRHIQHCVTAFHIGYIHVERFLPNSALPQRHRTQLRRARRDDRPFMYCTSFEGAM